MLEGKNIVIIGGTTGIGFSAACAFVRERGNVVVVGPRAEECSKAESAFGGQGLAIVGNATVEETAENAIETCIKHFGRIDGLYHVAGGSGRKFGDGALHQLTLSAWEKTLNLNLTTLMFSNRAAVRAFARQKSGGSILNMGSVLGKSPSPRFFASHAYAAAKSAVIGFSKSIASYYAKDNIRVNVIAPGLIQTPMSNRAVSDREIMDYIELKQPLDGGRIGRPDDLDGLAVFLLSDAGSYATGQVFTIDGGWSVTEAMV